MFEIPLVDIKYLKKPQENPYLDIYYFYDPLSSEVLITQGRNPDTTQKIQPVVFQRVFFPLRLCNKFISLVNMVNFASENGAFLSFFHFRYVS